MKLKKYIITLDHFPINHTRKFFLTSCVFALSNIFTSLTAQQLPLFSSFEQNLYHINPGMTGYGRFAFFSVSGKKQWVGFENSPFTQNFTAHSSLNEKNIGIGGSFTNDTRGMIRTTGFSTSFGYHLQTGEAARLGFGLTGNFYSYSLDFGNMYLYDPGDALLNTNGKSGLVPNFSFGIALNREDYSIGISALNILPAKIKFGNAHVNEETTHYFFHAKWRIQNAENAVFGFTPALLASYVDGYPFYGDFQTTFHFFNRVDLILGVRTNMDLHMGTGMEIIENLRLYYYYDMVLSGLKPGNAGSHEVFISYTWYYNPFYKGDKRRYKWIRKGNRKKAGDPESSTHLDTRKSGS